MHSLPLFVSLAGRPVILTGAGDVADAKRRLLERVGALVVGEDAQATLAIVADQDEATVARLKARGILVNAVDRPDLCDFTLPAIVDRDPVLIAIGTGGASAGLAKALRQRLEALLPARLGVLAAALYSVRAAMKRRWPNAADRRRAIDAGLSSGGIIDPLTETAPDNIEEWLNTKRAKPISRLIPIILASPDPDDLTLRTARLLGEADRLYHHPSVPAVLLDRARADATRISCASPPNDPDHGLSLWLEMRP